MKYSNYLNKTGSLSTKIAVLSFAMMFVSGVAYSSDANIPAHVQSKFKSASVASAAVKDHYIVVLKDKYVDQQVSAMSAQLSPNVQSVKSFRKMVVADMATEAEFMHQADVKNQYHTALSGFSAKMTEKQMHALLADERVAFIEQDQVMSISAVQNNPTWGLDRIDEASLPMDSQYQYDATGSGVNVYVIDTGILRSHSNFGNRVSSGIDFVDSDYNANDCNGHGTHVAGTIGSSTYGVAKGVALTGVRVLDCNGSGTNAGVIAGVDWVASNAVLPAVANMSLGGGSSTALDNSVRNAINSGVTFVVAAGNENSNACVGSPNRVGPALTVAASTSSDSRSSFSNWGSCVDLFAPGSSITSTWSNGGTNTISGTSMAAPHVAGVAALYLQSNRSASPAAVSSAIVNNAVSGQISNTRNSPNRLVQSLFGDITDPGPGNGLEDGVAINGISGSSGSTVYYTMEVPAGVSSLSFDIYGGSGDADLYVRYGAAPTTSTYHCRPYINGNVETCSFSNPPAGTYHIMLRGYRAYSGVSLEGNY